MNHETFISNVAAGAVNLAVAKGLLGSSEAEMLRETKLVYGAGANGLRGVTYYNRWSNGEEAAHAFCEVCAMGEESPTQLAGTTLHELGHVLAGNVAGHSKVWREACAKLGLRKARAQGHTYHMAGFAPELRFLIAGLGKPTDGAPASLATLLPGYRLRPCTAGLGTRGGKSRGVGSGSRLRLYSCECEPPVKVRVARDDFAAHCDLCDGAFKR